MKRILILIMINFIFYNFAADKKQLTEKNDPAYRAYLERCAKISEDVLEHLQIPDLVRIVHEYHCITYDQWKKNNSMFLWSAKMGNIDKVKELLEETDVNAQDKLGNTALIWIANRGNEEISELLINKGADLNIQDVYGNTALILAASKGHKAIVELLINAKADVNAQDKLGNTALMQADLYGHNEIVDILKKAGAKS